jgi:pathogenesis-related protein 1
MQFVTNVSLIVLSSLFFFSGCADGNDGDALPITAPAGAGGSAGGGALPALGDGTAGDVGRGGMNGAGGVSGMSRAGGGADAGPSGSGNQDMSGAGMTSAIDGGASFGETGVFVGTTAAHNRARAAVETDTPLQPLSWSPELAEYAQEWATGLVQQQCGTIQHRSQAELTQVGYGENIAARSSRGLGQSTAVGGWVAEEACWGYGAFMRTDSCDMQCYQALNSDGCGHYTQVVWRDTKQVGCGYATCDRSGTLFELWVCNYQPPGNFIGRNPY